MIEAGACAKINLSLEVVGRWNERFHALVSVIQTVSLCDQLSVERAGSFDLQCDDSSLQRPSNLVLRAAAEFQQRFRSVEGARIELRKSIPVAAGLGGGSSDAACVLVALARAWDVPVGCGDLAPVAAVIGSDVPYFLTGGTALVEGRGERVTPLADPPRTWLLLARPDLEVSTETVFAALTPRDWTDGRITRELAADLDGRASLRTGTNGLQQVLFALHPQAETCWRRVNEVCGGRALISGSGPTAYGLFDTEAEARAAETELRSEYWTAVASTCRPARWLTPCRPS
jgi:4-diphosphocytidyl-2-C-methyl-D-erythritol kinase